MSQPPLPRPPEDRPRSGSPDYKRVPLNRPEPVPEEPTLLGALVDSFLAESEAEGKARAENPLLDFGKPK